MRKLKQFGTILFILLAIFSMNTAQARAVTEKFVEGKDYVLLPSQQENSTPAESTDEANNSKKIEVLEFFSYGCPWCYQLEPVVQRWLKTIPDNIDFERIPVVYKQSWTIYAHAFYLAKNFDIEDRVTPALFHGLHKERKRLRTLNDMQMFFVQFGVTPEEVEKMHKFSRSINQQLIHNRQLMLNYKIMGIPTFVVAGKYKTHMQLAQTNERLIAIINYLIKKAEQDQKQAQQKNKKKHHRSHKKKIKHELKMKHVRR